MCAINPISTSTYVNPAIATKTIRNGWIDFVFNYTTKDIAVELNPFRTTSMFFTVEQEIARQINNKRYETTNSSS